MSKETTTSTATEKWDGNFRDFEMFGEKISHETKVVPTPLFIIFA